MRFADHQILTIYHSAAAKILSLSSWLGPLLHFQLQQHAGQSHPFFRLCDGLVFMPRPQPMLASFHHDRLTCWPQAQVIGEQSGSEQRRCGKNARSCAATFRPAPPRLPRTLMPTRYGFV